MAPDGCSRRDRPHVGRERELSRMMAAVVGPGGRGAIVAGDVGVGKSHLLDRAAAQLSELGWVPLAARGDRARSSPFSSLGSLLPPLAGDPQRWAVVLRRGVDHLVELAGPRRPLLVADDLHAFDAASATLLQHAVVDGRIRLIGSLRTSDVQPDETPDAVTALWKEEVVERLDLVPLARPEADELAEQLMDGPVDAESRSRLWQWTQGNPLLLTEVAALARERSAWRRRAGLWHLDHEAAVRPTEPDGPGVLSPTLAGILDERMAGAAPSVADVVDALALAGHLPLGVLDHLVGHRALAVAERIRLTRTHREPGGPVLTLDHPLHGELRRAQMGGERTTALRNRLLDVFERVDVTAWDVPLVARWYLETGRTGPRAAAVLTQGAEAAWAANDPRMAAELARRARQLSPGDRSGLVLVNALARLGEVEELRAVAAEVSRSAESDAVRAAAVMNLALFLFQFANQPDAAEDLLSEAAASVGDPGWRSALIKQAAIFRLQRGDLDGAETLALLLQRTSDPATAIDAATVMSPICLLRGQVAEALRLAEQGLSLVAGLDDVAGDVVTLGEHVFHQVGAWVEDDRLREADEIAQSAIAALDDDVDPFSRAFVAFQVGRIARLRGRPRTAARWFREAVAGFDSIHRDGFVAWALAGLTDVQAQVGDVAGAHESAARCRWRRNHPIGLGAGEVARALAWDLVATQRLDAAADAIALAARRSLEAGEVLHAAHAFHDLVRIGRAERAAQPLRDLAGRSDGQLVALFARHASATVAADLDQLVAVAERFWTMGCDLHAAEAWSQVTGLSRAVGQGRRSAAAHRRAVDCHRHCEGARTPLLASLAGVMDLSRREREIAQLARSGMRRRDIAAHLMISPRTVDSHLQRIYRKLGVEDRRGLADALPADTATRRGLTPTG